MIRNIIFTVSFGTIVLLSISNINCSFSSNPAQISRYDYYSSGPTVFGKTSCPKGQGKLATDFEASDEDSNSIALSLCSGGREQLMPSQTTMETNVTREWNMVRIDVKVTGSYTRPSQSPNQLSEVKAPVAMDVSVYFEDGPRFFPLICFCPIIIDYTAKDLLALVDEKVLDELVTERMAQKEYCLS